MTVAALPSKIDYIENGVTLAFALPFRFLTGSIEATRVLADGTVVPLASGVDFSTTGGSTDAGGALTLASSVSGATLRVRRVTSRSQGADYTTGDAFPAESHEAALDRAMLIDQEQDDKIADTSRRALLVPDGETAPVLPSQADRAGKLLLFDAGGGITLVPAPGSLPPAGQRWDEIATEEGQTIFNFPGSAGLALRVSLNGGLLTLADYVIAGDDIELIEGVSVGSVLSVEGIGGVALQLQASAAQSSYSATAAAEAFSVAHKLQQFFNPLDHPWGATGGGAADDTAALLSADAAAYALGQPLFITRAHRITANITLLSDLFFIGGSIYRDAGVTLSCKGVVSAAMSQIFTGPGSTVGIRKVRPEWFGAVRDGATDDAAALNACNACVVASGTSRGPGRPLIELSLGIYAIDSTVRFTPTSAINLEVAGAGSGLDPGTRIHALSTFGDTIAVHLDGQSNASTSRIADWYVHGFTVTRAGSAAQVGFWAGGNDTDINLVGMKESKVEDVLVLDFPVCWQFNQFRLCRFERCAGWAEAVAGGVQAKFTCDDPLLFTGDLTFVSCQLVTTTAMNGNNIRVEHDGAGQIKGVRWQSCAFYKANIALAIAVDGGAQVGDWWFDSGCQFDGYINNFCDVNMDGASTVVDDIHFDGIYIRGVNTGGFIFKTTITAGTFSGLFFTNAWIADVDAGSLPLFEMHGTMDDIHITGNTFSECLTSNHVAIFYDAATVIDFSHNNYRKRVSATAEGWIELSATADRYVVVGNKATAASFTGTVVSELNGAATKYVPAGANF
jgi:hypothetical protein